MLHRRGLIALTVLAATACGGRSPGPGETAAPETSAEPGGQITSAPQPTGGSAQTEGEGIQADQLLQDVLAYQLCSRLGGQILSLTTGGDPTVPGGEGEEIIEGRLWLEQCNATSQGNRLTMELGGRGWRWVSRERSKLGATFDLEQYVRFELDLAAVFDVGSEYARDHQMLIVWLRPRKVTKVNVVPIGEVEVEEEGAWAEVVGTAAGLFGAGTGERAAESVAEEGEVKFGRSLGEGFTIAVDLCTGSSLTERDLLSAEEVTSRRRELEDLQGAARIFAGGLDVAGPVENAPIAFDLVARAGSGGRARLYCELEAAQILGAYLEGNELPTLEPLAETLISSTSPSRIDAPDATCPVYLVVTPSNPRGQPLLYSYSAYERPSMGKAYVRCER